MSETKEVTLQGGDGKKVKMPTKPSKAADESTASQSFDYTKETPGGTKHHYRVENEKQQNWNLKDHPDGPEAGARNQNPPKNPDNKSAS